MRVPRIRKDDLPRAKCTVYMLILHDQDCIVSLNRRIRTSGTSYGKINFKFLFSC